MAGKNIKTTYDNNILKSVSEESLTIEVTTECNSNCSHCFARAGLAERTSMGKDTALSIVREGYDLGYRRLHITGGEPLLWEHFTALLGNAFALGFEHVFCNTNGTMLSKERCKELASCGSRLSLSVSLQGKEDLHDSIRGNGSYARAAEGIKNALRAGLAVSIFASVGKRLLRTLPEFAHGLSEEFPGIEGLVLIQLIRVENDALDLTGDLLEPGDFVQMVRAASMLSLCGIKIEILENPLANAVADVLGTQWLPEAEPLFRMGRTVVLADGNITLSHSSRESLGIYKPGILRKIIFSKDYITGISEDSTACSDCIHMDICRRNRMLKPSESFRDHNQSPYCIRVLSHPSCH